MAKEQARQAVKAVEEADIAVTEAVADHRDHPVVKAAGLLSEIGDQPPLRVICAATIATGLLGNDRRLLRAGVRMLAAHSLATGIKTLIKRSVDRTRPDHAIDTRYRMERGDSRTHELSSFPSGHTAGAVAVAEATARDYPGAALPLRLGAAAVAIVQIPRCKHFASDIVVGASIGWIAEKVASATLDRVEHALSSAAAARSRS